MIDIVIIGQNEGAHIVNMHNSLCERPYNRYWVLDRCTDNSEQQLQSLGEFYVKTPDELQGRQTSFARNYGLKYCNPQHGVLFLDGDRYITSGSIKELNEAETDISLLMIENDRREKEDFTKHYGYVLSHFYSCGIFLKREAINKILDFQNGELFSIELQQEWGVEDTYLGDVCYHLGLTAGLYKKCRLHGSFQKKNLESIEVLEKRLRKRDPLNVLWDW